MSIKDVLSKEQRETVIEKHHAVLNISVKSSDWSLFFFATETILRTDFMETSYFGKLILQKLNPTVIA